VHKKGGGTFERCDIYDNASAGAIVATQSSPVFVGCAIHDAKPRGGSIMRENLRHAVLEMRTVEIGSISEFVDRACPVIERLTWHLTEAVSYCFFK
jgi:hypothetical protein